MQDNTNDRIFKLAGESLVPLTQASALFPVPVSASSLQRYWRQGVRGNRLKTFLIFGRRYTTATEVERFVERSLVTDGNDAPVISNLPPQNRIAEASKRKHGLPPSGMDGVPVE